MYNQVRDCGRPLMCSTSVLPKAKAVAVAAGQAFCSAPVDWRLSGGVLCGRCQLAGGDATAQVLLAVLLALALLLLQLRLRRVACSAQPAYEIQHSQNLVLAQCSPMLGEVCVLQPVSSVY